MTAGAAMGDAAYVGRRGAVTPLYFGAEGSEALGWLTVPRSGGSRASALIVPALGREHVSSYRSLHRLADELAGRGMASLRFDYSGTGDSPGSLDDGCVGRWVETVRAGYRLLAEASVAPVWVVALRLGADIAAEALGPDVEPAAVVLWDPCESGATFLRQQRLLRAFTTTGDVDSLGARRGDAAPIEINDLSLSANDAGVLTGLSLRGWADRPAHVRTLLLQVDAAPVGPCVRTLSRRPDTTVVTIASQRDILETNQAAGLPAVATVDVIAEWASAVLGAGDEHEVRRVGHDRTTIGRGEDDRLVTERVVDASGSGVLGVLTSVGDETTPDVVFVNSVDLRAGPARQWAELSRAWALRHGVTSLRVDIGVVGDGRHAARRRRAEAQSWRAALALRTVLRCLASRGRPPVLVGHCAGAWLALQAGTAGRTSGVCLVNPQLWSGHSLPVLAGHADRLSARLPRRMRAAMDRSGLTNSPEQRLRHLRARSTPVSLIVGESELAAYRRAAWRTDAADHATRSANVRVVDVLENDHSLVTARARRRLAETLWREVSRDLRSRDQPPSEHRKPRAPLK